MTTANGKRRAVGVVRVSQTRGREEEEEEEEGFASPDVQRERITDACTRERLELVGVPFEELDVSGSTPLERRTGLVAAIEAVEAGRAEVIVVAYFDRLVRSLEVQAQVLRRVEAAGGALLAADSGAISQATAAQWLSPTMLGMVAEYHNRITAKKAGAAQLRAIRQGIPPMILPPGLRRVGDRVELEPTEAPVVAEAVRMRADGATVLEVRARLATNGIERSYHGTTSLLGSRLLVGEIVFGENRQRPEDVWRGECPAVVDRATWERAQRVSAPRGRRAKSDRLLARLGVLRCATCNARMIVGTQNRPGGHYSFYRCPPTGDCPRRVTIAAEVAERVVSDAARVVSDAARSYLGGVAGVRATRDNAREARAAVARAQDAVDAGLRTLADFSDEPTAVGRLRDLRDARDRAREQVEALGEPDEVTILLLDQDWSDLARDDQRRCIRATIERVLVHPTPRGTAPEDRLAVRHHEGAAMLTGRTPQAPRELS